MLSVLKIEFRSESGERFALREDEGEFEVNGILLVGSDGEVVKGFHRGVEFEDQVDSDDVLSEFLAEKSVTVGELEDALNLFTDTTAEYRQWKE